MREHWNDFCLPPGKYGDFILPFAANSFFQVHESCLLRGKTFQPSHTTLTMVQGKTFRIMGEQPPSRGHPPIG